MDGFPRTIQQANAVKEMNINIDYVIEFILPDRLIINRILGRRIHAASGRIYHIRFNPPKIKGKDDITGEILTTRKDDQEEIICKRLAEYHQNSKPLISFYKKEAYLGNTKYIKINSANSVDNIRLELEKILG